MAPQANWRTSTKWPCDRGGGRHRRAHQVRAAAGALAAFEVAVAGRGAALARLEPVGVHRQAHRAARLAPFEARVLEDRGRRPSRSACSFTRPEPGTTIASLTFDATRCAEPRTTAAASRRSSMRELVHEPMNTLSMRMSVDRLVRLEAHVDQRALHRVALARRPFPCPGSGTRPSIASTISGEVPQVTCGWISRGVERRRPRRSSRRRRNAACASRRRPASHSTPVGRERPALDVVDASCRRRATRPARAPASIAMLQTVMRPSIDSARIARAGELDRVAGAAGGADLADDGQHDVLGGARRAAARRRPAPACSSPSWPAASAWPARARPRWCRCRARARRRRRAWRCASRRRPPSCPAASRPAPGPITCTMPWRLVVHVEVASMPNSSQLSSSVSTCSREIGSAMPSCRGRWSARCGRRRPGWRRRARPCGRRSRRPSKACGLVTSCTRWRSM